MVMSVGETLSGMYGGGLGASSVSDGKPAPFRLFPLRRELRVYRSADSRGFGEAEWTIHDPYRNRFFRIGRHEFQMLAFWKKCKTAEELSRHLFKEKKLHIPADSVKKFHHFLLHHELLSVHDERYTSHLLLTEEKQKQGFFTTLLHHYLFFKIPLIKPDRFLEKTLPFVLFLGSGSFLFGMFLCGLVGLYLVSRQWEEFWQTFQYFFNFQGMLWYAVVIGMVKIIHEMAHAYVAKRHGLRVPSMGVAFLVMWPVLYTDTTDAWKLRSRRARLEITAAGMYAEFLLAVFATFLWSFLPDGVARSGAFIVATVTWVMAVVINFNMLMRFDGYYFLSDFLEVPNLQDRSFALGRWFLRRHLFGFDSPPPERFSKKKERILIFYAFATWIYRTILFLGIAFLVYAFFFKVLGIFLMCVELLWFLAMPLFREVKVWYKLRKEMSWNSTTKRNAFLLFLLLFLLFYPWKGSVERVAYLRSDHFTVLYPMEAGVVESLFVQEGDTVRKGDTLLQLSSDELAYQHRQASLKTEAAEWYLKRMESSVRLVGETKVSREKLQEMKAALKGVEKRMSALEVKAPFSGRVRWLNRSLRPGFIVGRESALLSIISDEGTEVISTIPEDLSGKLNNGDIAWFLPDIAEYPPVELTVKGVDPNRITVLTEKWFSSLYGGDVASIKRKDGKTEAHDAVYRVRMKPVIPLNRQPSMMLRGVVRFSAARESFAESIMRKVLFILIRESSF